MKALEPFNLTFFEEPLHYNDREGYQALTAETSVPIARRGMPCGLGGMAALSGG